MTWERTYLFENGLPGNQRKETLFIDQYDDKGQLTQISTFGNGEERTIFDRTSGKTKIANIYFDTLGNPILPGTEKFVGKTSDPAGDGLCKDFSLDRKEDLKERAVTLTERCADGTVRATERREFSAENQLIRYLRQDSKLRSWEFSFIHDPNGELIESDRIIENGRIPKFYQQVKYVVLEYDKMNNWIRSVASNFDSRRPGVLVHQFADERKIFYYEN